MFFHFPVEYILEKNASPLWNVILAVRAKPSVTAGFMRPPPYFQNIQTSDVIASQLHRAALNIGDSEWDAVSWRETADDDHARLEETLKLPTSVCQSAAAKHWMLTSRNVTTSSALMSRQKQRSNTYTHRCQLLLT